jgi:acyl-CoA synthetase (AMP-forming)/AMP-acid ligase II
VRTGKVCLWDYFEDQVKRLPPTEQAVWSRSGCYTWPEAYDMSNRYSQFMLSLGVEKRSLVGLYLTNSPQMLFAWLGSWGIGCAPAMINYNLAGEALIHCVKLSASKILLVDSDPECIARIEGVRGTLEGELGIRIVILDAATEEKINSLEPKRPGDEFRKGMLPTFPMALIYTRCVSRKHPPPS